MLYAFDNYWNGMGHSTIGGCAVAEDGVSVLVIARFRGLQGQGEGAECRSKHCQPLVLNGCHIYTERRRG